MENKFFHIFVAALFLGLLLLLTDPFMVWMPAPAQMAVLLVAAACAGLWVGLVVYERARDEREVVHTMHAGRVAYLSGIVVLTLALVVQGFSHAIDLWIPFTLAVMVVSKLAARIYIDYQQ